MRFVPLVAAACAVVLPDGHAADRPNAAGRPNIVVTLADDCTYWDMACYGGQAATPHLDALCAEGMRLDRCFQAAPMCSPTRHCLYTGLYPVRSGAYPNHTQVYQGVRSIAHYLRDAGYRVALNGKTHIGPGKSFPFEYQFTKNPKHSPDVEALDHMLAECRRDDQPFAAFYCSNEPHTPWDKGDPSRYPPDELELPAFFVDTPETRENFSRYLAEITYYDSEVGRVLELLERHGHADNTIVIVLSEQGNSFPFAKWTCYDAGLASGMIVRWPGRVAAGSTTDALVEYVDIVPTLLDAVGADAPADLDGVSFAPVLLGEADRHKDFVFGLQTTRGIINGSEHYGIRSVRSDRFRYIRNLTPNATFQNILMGQALWRSWVAESEAAGGHAREMV
ncbi:MAG: sulfatase, partial [Planctomycetota bacterium]